MKNLDNYQSGTGNVLTKQLQLLWRFAMVVVAVLFLSAPTVLAQGGKPSKDGFGGTSFAQYANKNDAWIPGILQSGKSEYYEGTSTLQRLVFVNIPTTTGNQHELTFKVLSTKAGINAYDYVTGFDQALQDYINIAGKQIIENVAPNNPFDPFNLNDQLILLKKGAIPNPATASLIESLFDVNNPLSNKKIRAVAPLYTVYAAKGRSDVGDAMNFYDGTTVGGKTYEGAPGITNRRGVQLYGDAQITTAELVFEGYSSEDPTTGDGYGLYTLKWTSASKNIMILMAGHLSIGKFSKYPPLEYGLNQGSSSISGGPYHFKLEMLDGISLGNQDNQIQSGSILPPPECGITPNDAVCPGTTTLHTAQLTEGATYNWIVTGQGTFTDNTTTKNTGIVNQIGVVSTGAGSYNLAVEITANGRTSTCNINVTVNGNPSVTVNSPTVCASALPATITATPGSGAASDYDYAWTVPSGAAAPGNVQSFTTSTAGTYSVVITHKTTGCASPSASGTLTINQNPTVTVNSPTVCASALPATITATPGSGAATDYNYAWTVPSGAAAPGNVSSFSTSTPGSYSVVITDKVTGCTGSGSGSLTVNSNPTVSVNSPIICSSALPATITATPGSGATSDYNYAWIVPNGASAPGNVSSFSTSTSGTYSVVITHKTTGCSGSGSGSLTINANPGEPTLNIVSPSCSSITGTITVISPLDDPQNNIDYEYSYNGGDYTDSPGPFTFQAGAGYSITYREKTIGCVSAAASCDPDPNYVAPTASNISSATLTAKAVKSVKSVTEDANNISAYPVPFSEKATVEFKTTKTEQYSLRLYDMKGTMIRELKTGTAKAGEVQEVEIDGKILSEGVYIVRMVRASGTESVKLLLKRE